MVILVRGIIVIQIDPVDSRRCYIYRTVNTAIGARKKLIHSCGLEYQYMHVGMMRYATGIVKDISIGARIATYTNKVTRSNISCLVDICAYAGDAPRSLTKDNCCLIMCNIINAQYAALRLPHTCTSK